MADLDPFTIPDVENAEPIEDMVARLRKNISSECSVLLKRTRRAGAGKLESIRARRFESKINSIIEAQAATFSIDELERLLRECGELSQELCRFES